jgi:lipopolysaccharide transport system permease protein
MPHTPVTVPRDGWGSAAGRTNGRVHGLSTRPIQVIEARPSTRGLFREVWAYRAVLRALAGRELRGRYRQATLGIGWALLQPVLQVIVFTLVFSRGGRADAHTSYAVFALAGLIPYNLFQQGLTAATPAFVAAQGIVSKVYFPRIYTVLASTTTAFVNAGVSLVFLAVLMAATRTRPAASAPLAIVALAGIVALTIGLGAMLSVLNARVRDVQHALPLVLGLAVYLSPAILPIDSMSPGLRRLVLLNPTSGLIDAFRSAITGEPLHSMTLTAIDATLAIAVLLVGVVVFQRSHAPLVDVL